MGNAKKYKYVLFLDILGTGKPERIKETVKAENAENAKFQVMEKYLNLGKMVDIISVERLVSSGRVRKIRSAVLVPMFIAWPE
jgi:hypothetical protein